MTLVYVSGVLVFGVFVGTLLDLLALPLFLAAASFVPATLFLRKHHRVIVVFLLAALLVGMARGSISHDSGPPEHLQTLAGPTPVEVSGVIDDYPEPRGGMTQFRFSIDGHRTGPAWANSSGLLLVRAKPPIAMIEDRSPPFFRYGDSLVLKGTLTEPPVLEEFDWRDHLAREDIHFLMFRPEVELTGYGRGSPLLGGLYRVREEMAESLDRSLPEPRASLAQALLLGIRGGLPSELRDDLARTGTTHLIAISGLHVGILVGMVSLGSAGLLGRRRHLYVVIPLLFVWAYAVLTGFSPPVARAAIMASLYLWAMFLGRQRSGLSSMSAAAALMVVVDPGLLREVSFQLSFLAMTGLLLLGPWFRAVGLRLVARYWEPEGFSGGILKFFIEASAISLAAILATLPVVAVNFHYLSPVGLPATVLILPVLPLVLVSTLAVAIVGMVSGVAGEVLAWVAWPWLSWMTSLIRIFSWIPGLTLDVGASGPYLSLAYYTLLVLLLWSARRRWPKALVQAELPEFPTIRSTAKPRLHSLLRQKRTYLISGAVLLVLAVISVGAVRPHERLRVTMLDVGQGNAILIRSPDGLTALVDGGPSPDVLALELGQRLAHWQRSIDLVVLTHPDPDHVAGLTGLLETYDVKHVIHCGADCATVDNEKDYLVWKALLARKGIVAVEAEVGTRIRLGETVGLHILHPPPGPLSGTGSDSNNNSVVLRLKYGEVGFLLTGDIEALAEGYLLRQDLPLASDVMTAPHHGSRTSSTAEFVAAVDPQLVLISAGKDNRYGHPDPETLATLSQRLPYERILATAEFGSIQVETDGARLWVDTEN